MVNGFIESEIQVRLKQIEVLEKEFAIREAASQRKIEVACKQHGELLASMSRTIQNRKTAVLSLQMYLDRSNVSQTAN